ncbi:MAG: hypothetical protein ACLFTH_03615 [Candidatus Woesearchaeota archaeon]
MHLGFHRDFRRKLSFGFEEGILLFIILLHFLDAFELIPPDLDYVKKIISWVALGTIIYNAKPSKIMVGSHEPRLDLILIAGYFFLIIKNLTAYAASILQESSLYFRPFFALLVENSTGIESAFLHIGLFLLVVVAIRYALTVKFRKPSIMHLLHEDKTSPSSIKDSFLRFLSSFAIILAFFVVIFNLFMEWLAIAIDAPLVIVSLATYFFFIFKHREHFRTGSFLARFGNFGEQFYKDFLEQLKTRKGVVRVLSGMIVLHALTDALSFLWPFIFGRADGLYFTHLTGERLFLGELFSIEASALGVFSQGLLGIVYIGNLIALLFFLLSPVLLWFSMYKDRKLHLPGWILGVFSASIITFLLAPLFRIRTLENDLVRGVDIAGQQALANSSTPLGFIVGTALFTGLFIGFLAHVTRSKKVLVDTFIVASQAFLTYYIALFFYSVSTYFIKIIPLVWSAGQELLGIFFSLVFILTVLFYIFGTLSFLWDAHKHLKNHLRL